jgi:hypothetical protein
MTRWLFLNVGLWVASFFLWPLGISTGRDLVIALAGVSITSLAYELFVVPQEARIRSDKVNHGNL